MYQQHERRDYRGHGPQKQEEKVNIDLKGMNYEQIDQKAAEIAGELSRKVTPNQMRNAFELIAGALKKLDRGNIETVKMDLLLTKPKIAYMVKEEKSIPMVNWLLAAIESAIKANDVETYKKLQAFNEALLGYFKYECEKNKQR
ncbi:MAG: type III-A CRISPR-associated protein Csm2 [Thermoplasmata archaeon]